MGIFLGVGTVLIYSEILKIHRKRPPRIIVTSWYGDAFRTSRQWFPLTQWPVMQGLGVFFVVSLNELSNTHSSYRWFQTPWRSCDATMLPIPSECLIMFALFFMEKIALGIRLMYFHDTCLHGPLARYVKLQTAHAPWMPWTVSPPPRVSNPDMPHGTCVTHVPWCMPGLLTSGFRWSQRRGETFPAFPAHAQPASLRIW